MKKQKIMIIKILLKKLKIKRGYQMNYALMKTMKMLLKMK